MIVSLLVKDFSQGTASTVCFIVVLAFREWDTQILVQFKGNSTTDKLHKGTLFHCF